MKAARVEIGSIVVHQPGTVKLPNGAALGHMVEAHLQQLMMQRSAPAESRQAGTVQLSAAGRNPNNNLAAAIARELYRSIQGKV